MAHKKKPADSEGSDPEAGVEEKGGKRPHDKVADTEIQGLPKTRRYTVITERGERNVDVSEDK